MNENKENYFFEKKNYFLFLMIWFFEKTKSFFCSLLKHFVSIFRLSQKCQSTLIRTMMYHQTSTIKKFRLMMRFFFSSSTSKQHSFENYLIRVFVLIFCRIASHRCSQISATKSHDTLHKAFFLLSWENRLFCTCRKISSRWIWRRDNHLRRFSPNFRLEKYWWSHILSNIRWKLETSFFHFFWVHLFLWEVKTLCNQTLWDEQSHFELIFSATFVSRTVVR
jgi:hypothetical protein